MLSSKGPVSFVYSFSIMNVEIFYKTHFLNNQLVNHVIGFLSVYGLRRKYGIWIKMFFLFLRNNLGDFVLSLERSLEYSFIYFSKSMCFFFMLDFLFFFLLPSKLYVNSKLVQVSSSKCSCVFNIQDNLPLKGFIFYSYFDNDLKKQFFSYYLKERGLFVDRFRDSITIGFEFLFSMNFIFFLYCSYFGFFVKDNEISS